LFHLYLRRAPKQVLDLEFLASDPAAGIGTPAGRENCATLNLQ